MTTSKSSYLVVAQEYADDELYKIDCLQLTETEGQQLHQFLRALGEHLNDYLDRQEYHYGCAAADSMWRLHENGGGGVFELFPVDQKNVLSLSADAEGADDFPNIIYEKQLCDVVRDHPSIKNLSELFQQFFFEFREIADADGDIKQQITQAFVHLYRKTGVRIPAFMYSFFRQSGCVEHLDLDSYDFSTASK